MLPVCALIATPPALLIGWWTFRAPKSKLVVAIAFLIPLTAFVACFVATVFFGLP